MITKPHTTIDTTTQLQQRARARAKEEQYQTLRRIVSKLTLEDAYKLQVNINSPHKTATIMAAWPYPQPLDPDNIERVYQEFTLQVGSVYDRICLLHQQRYLLTSMKADIRNTRMAASDLDIQASDVLGWRGWDWDAEAKCLVSPVTRTKWREPELRATDWDFKNNKDGNEIQWQDKHLRGHAGIHARRVPKDWKVAFWGGEDAPESQITGIVERFGKFVLGTIGWRAEWVFIRKLLAPTQEIGFQLEMAYPDVEVYYYDHEKYGPYTGVK